MATGLPVGVLAACGGHAAPSSHGVDTDAQARTFGHRLVDVLERDDLLGFQDLLSEKMFRRKHDERELLQMFTAWRAELLPYARALREADWTLAASDPVATTPIVASAQTVVRFRPVGGDPQELIRVVHERGALRIDEN